MISGEKGTKPITINKVSFPPKGILNGLYLESPKDQETYFKQHPDISLQDQLDTLEEGVQADIQQTGHDLDLAIIQVKETLPYRPIQLAKHPIKTTDPIFVGGYGMKRAISDLTATVSQDEAHEMMHQLEKSLKQLHSSPQKNEGCIQTYQDALNLLKQYNRSFDLTRANHGSLTADRRDVGLVFNQHFSLSPKKARLQQSLLMR